jgi:hypothetical protein
MFFLAAVPRFATSIRVEHDPVGTEERPAAEPAIARCLLHHVMVHSARSYRRRNASFSALKLPSDPAPEVAELATAEQARQARETRLQSSLYLGVQLTLEHGSAAHSTVRAAEGIVSGSPLF